MKQKEAIEKLKIISKKIDHSTIPRLWTVEVNEYSITKGEGEDCPIYDYDMEELVKENNLNFEKIQSFLECCYRNNGEALAEIENFEDFEDIRYFLFKHDSEDDQETYGLVDTDDHYKIDEIAGAFLTEKECENYMRKFDYREGTEEKTNPLYTSGVLKELLEIVRDTEWEE